MFCRTQKKIYLNNVLAVFVHTMRVYRIQKNILDFYIKKKQKHFFEKSSVVFHRRKKKNLPDLARLYFIYSTGGLVVNLHYFHPGSACFSNLGQHVLRLWRPLAVWDSGVLASLATWSIIQSCQLQACMFFNKETLKNLIKKDTLF